MAGKRGEMYRLPACELEVGQGFVGLVRLSARA